MSNQGDVALWLDCHAMTMTGDDDCAIIHNAAIATCDGRIAWIGPQKDCPPAYAQLSARHSLHGHWVTPGFIDCHTHLIYAGNRAHEFEQRISGMSYAQIAEQGGGIRATVRATRAASREQLFTQAHKRLRALIRQGVTCVEIKSGYGLNTPTETTMLKVAKDLAEACHIRIVKTFLGAHALPEEYTSSDAYIAMLCQEMLPALAEEQLVDAVDGFCETIAFSRAQIKQVFRVAKDYQCPVKLHADQLSNQEGAALAAQYDALSADHLEYVSQRGIQAMAEHGTTAVVLPGAFYFLGADKKPPICDLQAHNIPIAIASDCNPGSSPVTNILLMLNMACVLFGLTPTQALQGVTCHGARALGLLHERGTLSIGKVADFAVWDIEQPVDLVYPLGLSPCRQVVAAGHVIWEEADDEQ